MSIVKSGFRLYIAMSIHVAIAATAFVLVTYVLLGIPVSCPIVSFVFSGALFSYNLVKFGPLCLKSRRFNDSNVIIPVSIASLLIAVVSFLSLTFITQITAAILGVLVVLYVFPTNHRRQNIRNVGGIKIYIVAFCWSAVTVLLPVIDAGLAVSNDIMVMFAMRFIIVTVLVLIFDIIDLRSDNEALKTVPQQIGISATKGVGVLLLMLFFGLEYLKLEHNTSNLWANGILVTITAGFLLCANERRPKYYTTFWVESIPIIWCMLQLGIH